MTRRHSRAKPSFQSMLPKNIVWKPFPGDSLDEGTYRIDAPNRRLRRK